MVPGWVWYTQKPYSQGECDFLARAVIGNI